MKGTNKGNQHSRTALGGRLTPRQDFVMRLLAQGLRSKDIAPKLNVKPNTVASIVEQVCIALDARTMAQAMSIWAVADYLEANEEDE